MAVIAVADDYVHAGWADGRGGVAIDAFFAWVDLRMIIPLPCARFRMMTRQRFPLSTGAAKPSEPAAMAVAPATSPSALACLGFNSRFLEIAADPEARALLVAISNGAGVKAALQFAPEMALREKPGTAPEGLPPQRFKELVEKLAALYKQAAIERVESADSGRRTGCPPAQ